MTPRKPAPQVVVAPEKWVLSAAELAARIGITKNTVLENLVLEADKTTKVAAKDVPAQLDGSEKPVVVFDLGGGVFVPCWKRPNNGICFYRLHAERLIDEALSRAHHPSVSGR